MARAVVSFDTTTIFGVPGSLRAIERAIDEPADVRIVAAVHEQGGPATWLRGTPALPGALESLVLVQAGCPAAGSRDDARRPMDGLERLDAFAPEARVIHLDADPRAAAGHVRPAPVSH